eukprot:TRINITY_DN12418_c0_g1_i4.p3 TRINITY_DN12418_c0_g1~~TRINITY_DN12418_c0_g1_i4.p3  ORF type:complete len:251 (+),score=-17.49 TRINITY_DN12418_c0_g1_i4:225-977(+)
MFRQQGLVQNTLRARFEIVLIMNIVRFYFECMLNTPLIQQYDQQYGIQEIYIALLVCMHTYNFKSCRRWFVMLKFILEGCIMFRQQGLVQNTLRARFEIVLIMNIVRFYFECMLNTPLIQQYDQQYGIQEIYIALLVCMHTYNFKSCRRWFVVLKFILEGCIMFRQQGLVQNTLRARFEIVLIMNIVRFYFECMLNTPLIQQYDQQYGIQEIYIALLVCMHTYNFKSCRRWFVVLKFILEGCITFRQQSI